MSDLDTPTPPDGRDTRGPVTIDDWVELLTDSDACCGYGCGDCGGDRG